MKVLFIIVTLMSLLYLGAQTKTFTHWWTDVFVPTSLQNTQNIQEASLSNAAANGLVQNFEALEKANKEQIDMLTKQINKLSIELANVQKNLATAQDELLLQKATKKLKGVEVSFDDANDIVNNEPSNSTPSNSMPSYASQSHNEQSTVNVIQQNESQLTNNQMQTENEKRLQQQAILRELAQKMELASLSSLTSR
jgi:hypothetical protein